MCANLVDLKQTVAIFEKEKIEYLHIDVMDGEFVPNFGLGSDYIRGLRELTKIPLDIHMMVAAPEYKFKWVGIRSTDTVSIHYESTPQIQRALWNLACDIAVEQILAGEIRKSSDHPLQAEREAWLEKTMEEEISVALLRALVEDLNMEKDGRITRIGFGFRAR